MQQLLVTLERDAEQQCTAILERARQRAQEAVDAATREAESLELDYETRRRAALAQAESLARRKSGLAAKQLVYRARNEALETAFDAARRALDELPGQADWRSVLDALVTELVPLVGDEPATVTVPPADVASARRLIDQSGLPWKVISEDMPPGVRVTYGNGRKQIDNTLAGRLDTILSELRGPAERILLERS